MGNDDFRRSAKKRLYYAHFLARVDLSPFYYPIRILIELGNFLKAKGWVRFSHDTYKELRKFQVRNDRKEAAGRLTILGIV